jgi:hypothetical protein
MSKKTPRSANLSDLGLNWSYGEKDPHEAELVAALASTHPRQFWDAAKHCLKDRPRDNEHLVVQAFSGREALVRAGLSYARKHGYNDSHGYGHNRYGRNPAYETMVAHAMALPGKSARFQELVAARADKRFSKLHASEIFATILEPARAGNAYASLLLARLLPDSSSTDSEQAKRHENGRTGFASMDVYDSPERALTVALIHAQTHGIDPSIAAKAAKSRGRPARLSGNAFFWIAHRHLEESAAGSPSAGIWAQAGVEIVRRCAKGLSQGPETLALALGIKPFRDALLASRPQMGDRHYWSRDQALFEAFKLCAHDDVKTICDYAATGPSPTIADLDPTKPDAPRRYQGGLPSWALAVLAGHSPDPAWMPQSGAIEAQTLFKIPKSSMDMAKLGTLSGQQVDRLGYSSSGASYDAPKLCKSLGHSWPVLQATKNRKAKP